MSASMIEPTISSFAILVNAWLKPRQVIQQLRYAESGFIRFMLYWMLGAVAVFDSELLQVFGFDRSGAGIVLSFFWVFFIGLIVGMLYRIVWVNLVFFSGKIWHGAATNSEIDWVLALAAVSELVKLLYIVVIFLTSGGDADVAVVHPFVSIICAIFSIRIMIIGLSTVQKFSFGISIVNMLLPALVLVVVVGMIRTL